MPRATYPATSDVQDLSRLSFRLVWPGLTKSQAVSGSLPSQTLSWGCAVSACAVTVKARRRSALQSGVSSASGSSLGSWVEGYVKLSHMSHFRHATWRQTIDPAPSEVLNQLWVCSCWSSSMRTWCAPRTSSPKSRPSCTTPRWRLSSPHRWALAIQAGRDLACAISACGCAVCACG